MPEPGKWEPWWSGVSRCALLRFECKVFPFLACGTWFPSSFAGLEGGGLKCTRGGARGDRPLSGRRCRFTVSYLLCLLLSAWLRPVRHSWCTVYFEHFVDVSYHLTCLSALDLFGACLTALHVVGVSLFCEAGSAVRGLDTRQLWWPWFACLAPASRCKCKQDSVGVRRILVVPRDSGGASAGFCWCVWCEMAD